MSDSKEGIGKLVLSNGEFYEGEFENDRINGKGRFVGGDGQVVKGVWKDNRLMQIL